MNIWWGVYWEGQGEQIFHFPPVGKTLQTMIQMVLSLDLTETFYLWVLSKQLSDMLLLSLFFIFL